MKQLTSDEGDRIIVRPNRFIMFFCGRLILSVVRKVINRAYERGKLTSYAYHELHALADRSLAAQKGSPEVRASLHVYSTSCSWSGPIEATGRIKGMGIPCCPHCGSVLYQIEEDKWQAGIPQHEAKGHAHYAEFMAWSEKQPRCYKTLRDAAIAFKAETGKEVIFDLPQEWRVYIVEHDVNGGETYMARSADEAWAEYVKDVGETEASERSSRDEVRQLTDAELDSERFAEDDEDTELAGKTFREALAIEVAASPKPRQFSTQYAP